MMAWGGMCLDMKRDLVVIEGMLNVRALNYVIFFMT